jgi:C4-dicarboxylate-specific signal transduction histidine kinase
VHGPLPDVEAVTGRSAARQILVNLVRNAVAAVRLAGVAAPVELGARVEGGAIVVSIRDRGAGIEPGLAPRLFAPFASGRADGIGLGLFVSRALAERIGAGVELRNRDDGPGAIALLTLRAA